MKKIIPIYPFLGLALCLSAPACRKSIPAVQDQSTELASRDTANRPLVKQDSSPIVQSVPFPLTPVTGCSYSPNYGDTIIYPQPNNGQDYIVTPINNPGAGKYLSWPIGMVIDSTTGAINVTQSETGMKYAIGFVKNGTTDTCLSTLIIGGAAYMDSIYVLANGATAASPYYDANPLLPPVCSGGGCTFDVTGSAANQKVVMNTATGVIDLTKTLNGTGLLGGVFGLLPLNGQTVTSRIYYRLNDASNNALQHIDVQFVYYYSRSQIGQGLLNNVLTKLTNILMGNMISTYSDPRPPLIVIVRRP